MIHSRRIGRWKAHDGNASSSSPIEVPRHQDWYATYYKLVKASEDDPNVERKQAARGLARFMRLHPYNIAQKTEVMVEHFNAVTRHKVGGKAKAMVVTGSRLEAVRYKLAFDAYIREKGYNWIKTLVAFSGEVVDDEVPGKTWTEVGMNGGIKESELPEKFDTSDYQVLLVAEKYQTGYDQPLLHTMYVDKRLAGILAVQTLPCLNRMHPLKEDIFARFMNERDFQNLVSEWISRKVYAGLRTDTVVRRIRQNRGEGRH